MKIDRLGVWINTIGFPFAELAALAKRLEGWGYGMLWINDGMGGDPMLEVAGTMADGAHPFMTTPGHTAMARSILGPDKLLLVEQTVMLETDPAVARQAGRALVAGASALPNYRNNILRMGFTTDDLENGGSDRLVDALLAWGDEAAIRKRIQEHWDAGADQVAIQVTPKGAAAGGGRFAPGDEGLFALLAARS